MHSPYSQYQYPSSESHPHLADHYSHSAVYSHTEGCAQSAGASPYRELGGYPIQPASEDMSQMSQHTQLYSSLQDDYAYYYPVESPPAHQMYEISPGVSSANSYDSSNSHAPFYEDSTGHHAQRPASLNRAPVGLISQYTESMGCQHYDNLPAFRDTTSYMLPTTSPWSSNSPGDCSSSPVWGKEELVAPVRSHIAAPIPLTAPYNTLLGRAFGEEACMHVPSHMVVPSQARRAQGSSGLESIQHMRSTAYDPIVRPLTPRPVEEGLWRQQYASQYSHGQPIASYGHVEHVQEQGCSDHSICTNIHNDQQERLAFSSSPEYTQQVDQAMSLPVLLPAEDTDLVSITELPVVEAPTHSSPSPTISSSPSPSAVHSAAATRKLGRGRGGSHSHKIKILGTPTVLKLGSSRASQSPSRNASPSQAVIPPKEKKLLACLFCRQRKIACSASAPGSAACGQCARRGIECRYPAESRRGMRTPKKKSARRGKQCGEASGTSPNDGCPPLFTSVPILLPV